MGTNRVVHAVVASAIIRDFGASERQYSALAAFGLLRRLGGPVEKRLVLAALMETCTT